MYKGAWPGKPCFLHHIQVVNKLFLRTYPVAGDGLCTIEVIGPGKEDLPSHKKSARYKVNSETMIV